MKKQSFSIKRLIQDPVKNEEELKQRKKKIVPLFLVSLAIPIVLIIIAIITGLDFLTFIGIFALLFALVYFISIFSIMNKLKAKFKIFRCDSCNTQIDFCNDPDKLSKYATYEIIKENTKSSINVAKTNEHGIVPSIKATINSEAIAQITITCPNCGKSKTFKYSFKTFECIKTVSNVHARDLRYEKDKLENTLNEIVSTYESEHRDTIPYSVYSKHHPNFENRFKLQITGEDYNGFTVKYHVATDEMVERFILGDDVSGKIIAD